MIPAALFAMLAIARLRAIHAVVFGGFSPPPLAQRMEASRSKAIMTASCGIEGNKSSMATSISLRMPLRRVNSSHKRLLSGNAKSCNGIRLLRRPVSGIGRDWLRVRRTGVSRLSQWQSRAQMGYILSILAVGYTVTVFRRSSITDSSIRNHWTLKRSSSRSRWPCCWAIKSLFGIHGPGDVMFCAPDIDWVVGHSYILYAPLLAGAITYSEGVR